MVCIDFRVDGDYRESGSHHQFDVGLVEHLETEEADTLVLGGPHTGLTAALYGVVVLGTTLDEAH